jgi:hypothetical protein
VGKRLSARVTFPDSGVYSCKPHIREDYGQGDVPVRPRNPDAEDRLTREPTIGRFVSSGNCPRDLRSREQATERNIALAARDGFVQLRRWVITTSASTGRKTQPSLPLVAAPRTCSSASSVRRDREAASELAVRIQSARVHAFLAAAS